MQEKRKFYQRWLRWSLCVIAAAVLLEIFLFQYDSICSGRMGDGVAYPVEEIEYNGFERTEEDETVSGEGVWLEGQKDKASITIYPGTEVKTIHLSVKRKAPTLQPFTVTLSYKDEAYSACRENHGTMEIAEYNEGSTWIACDYLGKVSSVTFTFSGSKGTVFYLEEISLNGAIPFRFSMARVFLLAIPVIFLYLWKHPVLKESYCSKNRHHRVWCLGAFCISAFCIVLIYMLYVGQIVVLTTGGDQISKELPDAFLSGRLSLLQKPTKALLALDNPYDWAERSRKKISYLWDHLLYNGKYYSYYGIGPVLTLFLPVKVLTGWYLYTPFACLLYALGGTWFLGKAWTKAVENCRVSLRTVAGGMIVLQVGSGVLFNIQRPKFYETAELAGFFFAALGLYALCSSGFLRKQSLSYGKMAAAICCFSLAVLSRPTYALYAVGIGLWLVYGLQQYHGKKGKVKAAQAKREQMSGRQKRHTLARYCLAAFLPFILFGMMQMIYNYKRFGSVLDFGISYSLTINDFTKTKCSLRLVCISLWNFFFAIPKVDFTFPFFHGNPQYFGENGYYFFDTSNCFGLFWRMLPLWGIGQVFSLWKQKNKTERLRIFLFYLVPALIIPSAIVAATWESGHALRYNLDFAWQMNIGILLFLCVQEKNDYIEKRIPLWVSWAVVSNLLLVFQFIPSITNTGYVNEAGTQIYYMVKWLVSMG